ncbi:MAG TPA: YggS family pyridoxal phosphate-dependent enzyme [bacterium]|nr:YggS family pyridoxal phosphate-dependent enzyme [bacterium]
MSITQNIKDIREEIPENVRILAAAKTRTADEIRETVQAGVTIIGENYIQELRDRYNALEDLNKNLEWHMIGHLQTNKINKTLQYCSCIQTVESKKKARAINKRVPKANRNSISILIEVNIGEEESKFGIDPDFDKIAELAKYIDDLDHLHLEGLMTIEPYGKDPAEIRPYFQKMKKFYDKLQGLELSNSDIKTLSMGISNSYKIAIEEGSNMIRPGTAIYGPRDYS